MNSPVGYYFPWYQLSLMLKLHMYVLGILNLENNSFYFDTGKRNNKFKQQSMLLQISPYGNAIQDVKLAQVLIRCIYLALVTF